MTTPLFSPYYEHVPAPEVHTLVAFAADYISHSSGLPPITPHCWYASRSDRPEVLDAIAALCVTPAHQQSTAVAVMPEVQMRKLGLLICQGGVESPDKQLLTHVRKTWNLLRAIAEQKGAAREEAELRLFRYVYLFQEYEVLRIVRESWPKVELANRQLGRAMRREKECNPVLKRRFQRAATALRLAVQLMGDDLGVLTTAEWKKLQAWMATACGQADHVFRQWHRADEWGVSFADVGHPGPSPARLALRELLALPQHLITLCSFARTPSSRQIFASTLQVSFLTCPSRAVEVDTLTLRFTSEDRRQITSSAWLTLSDTTLQDAAPHAMCNLVSHLCKQRAATLSAIGLSAPACAACKKWIDWHGRWRRRYSYRGTDGSWRWPWAMVPGVDERVLAERVLDSCREYVREIRGTVCKQEPAVDDDLVIEMEREMEEWWMETDSACVFGCMVSDGCACFESLYGMR